MKKIINYKKYDTETAREIGRYENGYLEGDFEFYRETLYQKQKGEYFLYGEGGACSEYRSGSPSGWGPGWRIEPLTDEEADYWAMCHLTADEYIDEFGDVEE